MSEEWPSRSDIDKAVLELFEAYRTTNSHDEYCLMSLTPKTMECVKYLQECKSYGDSWQETLDITRGVIRKDPMEDNNGN